MTIHISDTAQKILRVLMATTTGLPVDVTQPAAIELLDQLCIKIEGGPLGPAGFDGPQRWVSITDRGRAVFASYATPRP